MPIKTICAAALAMSLAAACSTPAADAPPATSTAIAIPAPTPLPALAGVYGGSYTCADGEHGFFPTVTAQGGPAGMVAGSFTVSGTISADGAIAMTAGAWLKEPADYGAANLEGTLSKNDAGGYTLRGKPVVPGRPDACNDLLATRFLP